MVRGDWGSRGRSPAWAQLCLVASRPPQTSGERAGVLKEKQRLAFLSPRLESRFFLILLSDQGPLGSSGPSWPGQNWIPEQEAARGNGGWGWGTGVHFEW